MMVETGSPKVVRWLYIVAVVGALFTGFGNMPLYGRYYIADIPGLGWSGDFFANLQIHYLSGSLLLMIGAYAGVTFLLERRVGIRLTRTGVIRSAVLLMALASGIVLAIRNFPGIALSFELQVAVVFFHMGMAILFMALTIGCTIARCRWIRYDRELQTETSS